MWQSTTDDETQTTTCERKGAGPQQQTAKKMVSIITSSIIFIFHSMNCQCCIPYVTLLMVKNGESGMLLKNEKTLMKQEG